MTTREKPSAARLLLCTVVGWTLLASCINAVELCTYPALMFAHKWSPVYRALTLLAFAHAFSVLLISVAGAIRRLVPGPIVVVLQVGVLISAVQPLTTSIALWRSDLGWGRLMFDHANGGLVGVFLFGALGALAHRVVQARQRQE